MSSIYKSVFAAARGRRGELRREPWRIALDGVQQ